jgi:hypothetical protein
MKIKLSYNSESDIPEGYADLYTEKDGKWVLTNVEGMKTQEDINKQLEANRKERDAHKETLEKLKAFGDLDPEETLTKLDRIEELEAAAGDKLDDAKINEMVESRMKTKIAPLEREIEKLKSENGEKEKSINEYKEKDRTRHIEDAVRKAAIDAKIVPTALDDVLLLANRVFDVSEDGSVFTKDNSGVTPGVEPSVFLSDMQEKRPHWWPASQGGGAGGNNGNGMGGANNPFTAKNWNLTEQGKLHRESPEKAEQMAKAAGVKLGATRPAEKN